MKEYHSGESVSQVMEAEYESVTQAIVASVATLENCRRTELPQLFGATDPEALDTLFDESDLEADLTVELTIGEFVVQCTNWGTVTSKQLG